MPGVGRMTQGCYARIGRFPACFAGRLHHQLTGSPASDGKRPYDHIVAVDNTSQPDPPGTVPSRELSSFGRWLQDHDRRLRGSPGRIGVDVVPQVAPPGPQARAFVPLGRAGPHHARSTDKVNASVGMRLEVEPPSRFAVSPAIHGHGDQVRPVLVVTEDRDALPARATPDRLEAHRAPLVRLWPPQAASATREAVDRTVHCPSGADEPAWRESWAYIGPSGHLVVLLQTDLVCWCGGVSAQCDEVDLAADRVGRYWLRPGHDARRGHADVGRAPPRGGA